MELTNLMAPPFCSTLMGMMKGAADYYDLDLSAPALYGGSGHAFLMSIHKELCPSGPYCWNREPFFRALANLGIETVDHGFFWSEGGACERGEIEKLLKDSLDGGVPCGLVNMEYQLITGYDDTGFLTSQPWPGMDFPPGHLTFGTWEEFGECHVIFLTFRKVTPASEAKAVGDALRYAVDLYRNPLAHSDGDYAVGAGAYANWIAAVEQGHGSGHGNWWNGTVWAECRARAADYLAEIDARFPGAAGLASDYRAIAEALARASDKEMDSQAKIETLKQAATTEADCVSRIEELAAAV